MEIELIQKLQIKILELEKINFELTEKLKKYTNSKGHQKYYENNV